ncbi:DNA-binding HxlR family transcriptional regulator [Agromyces terreus]|uniref:DNA-binding HxlR family transcriptional regulator n=1 Tax=Agromyces terreus TaxID=424795 RepID=A0A9X2KDS2_9MICO|nr:helix-turn-helix domain-containing protein [Agromyces terreus]MCP2369867.1 DNA-binding HxlR family transcriptional regulator [Agromyces terreus]
MATRAARGYGQYSGTARALERVGDRWALLIVRDLLVGPRRYGDLKASLARIPTNILSDRLRELQESGVVRRVPSVRGGYELTESGRALEPVVLALERWGWAMLGDRGEGESVDADALAMSLRAAFRADAAAALPPSEYVLHVGGVREGDEGGVSLSAVVVGASLDVVAIGPGALPAPRRRSAFEPVPEAVLELELEPAQLHRLLTGDPGRLVVPTADEALLDRFAETFRIESAPPPAESGDAQAVPA